MANPMEVHVTDRPRDKFSDERRGRLGGEFADWNPHQTSHKAPVRVEEKTGVQEIVAGRNETSRVYEKGTAYASAGLRPGHVIVNGMETTVEALRRAGYDVIDAQEGEQRRPFQQQPRGSAPSSTAHHRDTFPTIPVGGNAVDQQQRSPHPQPAVTPQKPQGEPQGAAGGQEDNAAGQTPQEAIETASGALQAIAETHGTQAVYAGLGEVADDGHLPDADQLPHGVDMGAVEKIVAGYTAQANEALSSAGASVDMLMETLSDDDLREARRATIMGDSAKLQHLGARAVSALAMLPSRDPEGFAEMVEGMRPEERKALSQARNGEWVVTVPGRPAMGFAAAVRAGIVRV